MKFNILEMLYSTAELHTLSYQFYQQMPEKYEREAYLRQVWQECDAVSDPHVHSLFLKLEDAINHANALQNQANFSAGVFLVWQFFQTMTGFSGYSAPSPHRSN